MQLFRLVALLIAPPPLLQRVLQREEAAMQAGCAGVSDVHAALFPLINGPRFLPLHVAVRIHGRVFDFVPAKPTASETLAALATGRPVPGLLRCRPSTAASAAAASAAEPSAVRWRHLGRTQRTREDLESFALEQARARWVCA